MGCASGLVKYLVFLFNLVFALAGLAMLVVGILYQLEIQNMSNVIGEKTNFTVGPILLLVIGAIVFVISFFGCCGAIRESTCMLTTYGIILITLLILQIALGVFVFLQVKDSDKSLENEVQKALDKAYRKYDSDKTTAEAVDILQQVVKCCGNRNTNEFPTLKASCCPEEKCDGSNRFKEPCSKAVYPKLKSSIELLGYVALGLCATELIAAIFSFCLCSSINNERRRGHYA